MTDQSKRSYDQKTANDLTDNLPQPPMSLTLQFLTGSRFGIDVETRDAALADIQMGMSAPGGFLQNGIVELLHTPILLSGHDHPDVINRALVEQETGSFFSEKQRVVVHVIDKDQLNASTEDVVRFLCGPVANAHFFAKDPTNSKQKTWHQVVNTLLNNPSLEKAVAKHVFEQRDGELSLWMIEKLCAYRAADSTISTYRTAQQSAKAA